MRKLQKKTVIMIATKIPMYEGAPWCLGRHNSFEVNQPKLITLLGHDYVIWQDEAANLNAIDNICPHAGANLAKGGYIVDFQGKNCLACPYHGNKVQFFGDGKLVIDGNISNQAIQTVLPLKVVDGLVWTYGLSWREKEGKLVAQTIEPKLPIPDYRNVSYLTKSYPQLKLEGLNHIYSKSQSVDCNLAQAIWNIHDGEHFAGTHRDTMLSQEIKIDNLTQNEHKLSWQLILHKRSDRAVKNNKMNLLVEKEFVQSFNTFLPSLAVITLEYRKKLIVGIVTLYPESSHQVRLCLDSYTDLDFTWWQKLIRFPQMANLFRDRLIFEDIAILENLYETFDHKITLKNDTPAELAMNYLQTWHN
jgi:phenylpropionate dioxygenase-like ring-hydroxylating dioxygenase large terminal subunit